MRIIELETKRGDLLYGCIYGEEYKHTCVIITNGICGNIFENKFLRMLGEELEKNKIAFMYAHNSGAFHRIDTKTKSGIRSGCMYELFDNCLEDLQAYVDWAKASGFKRIILGGHSYGTNKVIFYLSKNQKEKIDKYILISPTDIHYLNENKKKSAEALMPIALLYEKENKLDTLLPFAFDNYQLYTARAFLDFMHNKNSNNLPIYSKSNDWSQLQSVKQPGLLIMGEKDEFAFGNTLYHLQTINQNSQNRSNVVKVIQNADHNFINKEFKLVQEILNFLQ